MMPSRKCNTSAQRFQSHSAAVFEKNILFYFNNCFQFLLPCPDYNSRKYLKKLAERSKKFFGGFLHQIICQNFTENTSKLENIFGPRLCVVFTVPIQKTKAFRIYE